MGDDGNGDSNDEVILLFFISIILILLGGLIVYNMFVTTPRDIAEKRCLEEHGGKDTWWTTEYNFFLSKINGTWVCDSKQKYKNRIMNFMEAKGGEWNGGYQELSIYIGYEKHKEWNDYENLDDLIQQLEKEGELVCEGDPHCRLINNSLKKKVMKK